MPKIHKRNCAYCGEYYEGRGKLFCSKSCRMKDQNRWNNPAKRQDVRAKMSQSAKGNKRCLGRKLSKATRAKIAKTLRGRALDSSHRAAISKGVRKAKCKPPRNPHLVGPNHPNWNGGHSKVRQQQSNNPEYLAFRSAVLDRDNWTCQDCGKRGGKLHAHHLKPWGPHPELRYEPSNGITLCSACHHSRHKNQPRPITVGPRTIAELYQEGQDALTQT